MRGTWVFNHHGRAKETRAKIAVKTKERHEKGLFPPSWCKGLTKETDERVKKLSEKTSETFANNPMLKKQASQTMKNNWKTGKIKKVSGPDHPRWKGGISKLIRRLNAASSLYKLWKYPILCRDKFKCILCQSVIELNVHHYNQRISEIISHFASKQTKKLTYKEEGYLVEEIVKYHLENKISGVTLCRKCHKETHKKEKLEHRKILFNVHL